MGELFLSVLNMSITASYVILIVILIRLLLKKAPKVISYALWIVVAFRLIIPFTLESSFSLIPSNNNVDYIPHNIIYQQNPQVNIRPKIVEKVVNDSIPAPAVEASANPLQIYVEMGAYIWLLIIVLLLVYSLISVLILKRRLASAKQIGENIFEAKNIRTAFVLGLIKPKIYLPAGLTKEEQEYIIIHEQTHINRKDHIVKMLAFLILSVHWFNPLVWIAFKLMSKDMELSCDERVLKEMDVDIKKAYATSLLSLNIEKHVFNSSPLAFGEGNVKSRIKNVLSYKKPAFWVTFVAVIFTFTVGMGLLTNQEEKISNDNNQELLENVTTDKVTNVVDGFSQMDNFIRYYSFDVSYDEELQSNERVFSVHGAYDLNGDGELDEVNAVLKSGYEDGGYIQVNDAKVDINLYFPDGGIKIIDLDRNDNYTELAVFDDGPSGDPSFTFFRYDGEKLYPIGTLDRYALMDGQGKFISWYHLANNFNPQFFSARGEFKDNEYVITNHHVEQYVGKTYEVDGSGYFIPLDNNPEDYYEYINWEPENMREFEATKIKLLDIHISPEDRTLNYFYVELPDGEKGLLYFWIGD